MVKEYTHTKRARRGNAGAQYGYNNGRPAKTADRERARADSLTLTSSTAFV